MATTPGQPPPGTTIVPSSVPHPNQPTQPQQPNQPSITSLPSCVQRIDVPVSQINVPGTVVRVSQATGHPQQQPMQNVTMTRPQIVTSTTPSGQTIFQAGMGTLQNLGLMVTRFPDNTRPGQIFLQQRPAPGVGRPVVVTSTATGQQIIHQASNMNVRAPIRTAIVSGPGATVATHGNIGQGTPGHGPPTGPTIQVMNLSAVPSNVVSQSGVITTGNKQQQAATTFLRSFGNTFEGQTVNFIQLDTNRGQQIRLSSDLIKNATVSGNKYPRVGVSNVGIVSSAQKIVNIGSAVSVSAPMTAAAAAHNQQQQQHNQQPGHTTQVTRLNIIPGPGGPGHQMVTVGTTGVHGKQGGVINIAPIGGQKVGAQQQSQPHTVILNPATNQIVAAACGPGIAKLQSQGVKTTVVAMNQGAMMQQQQQAHLNPTVINASALRGLAGSGGVSIGPGGAIVSHGLVSSQQQQLQHPSVVAITSSPIKGNQMIGSSTHQSPLKSTQQSQQPQSPARPSILARKRNLDSSSQGSSIGRSPMKSANLVAEGLAAKVEAELTETSSSAVVNMSGVTTQIISSSALTLQPSSSSQLPSSGTQQTATPRKKPRKQVLETFSLSTSANMKLLTSTTGSGDESAGHNQFNLLQQANVTSNNNQQQQKRSAPTEQQQQQQVNDVNEVDESIEPVDPLLKKFRPALYTSVIPPWKSLQFHFLRYTDVKPRPEKRMTLSELSNEGLQKKNGWKIHHLATQMIDMGEDETAVLDRLKKLLNVLEEKKETPSNGLVNNNNNNNISLSSSRRNSSTSCSLTTLGTPEKVIDLVRGNLQRSNIFREQMNESQQLLIKLTNDHREKVAKLTRKNMHKRTLVAK